MKIDVNPDLDIAVLCGGTGAEREVSLISGNAVYQGLLEAGWNARLLDIPAAEAAVRALDCDAAFIALHGEFGEDGVIQKILEDMNMPFTGNSSDCCALTMNKHKSKNKLVAAGLPTPAWTMVCNESRKDVRRIFEQSGLTLPIVVKPNSRGSSVGTTILREISGLEKAVDMALEFDSEVMLEEFIPGRELTVGIVGGMVLPVIELKAHREFYDYEAKYNDDNTEYLCPAPLGAEMSEKLSQLGLNVNKALDVDYLGRVDIMLGAQGPMVLEVNTIPGFTSHSLLPMAARACGISFPELCGFILTLGLKRFGLSVDS